MDSVFSLPRLQKQAVPPGVGSFFSTLAPLLVVPRSSRALLESFAGIDVKAERVAALLRANQAYEFLFMRNVQALSKREQVPTLESAVVLFGMQNTRNWLVAIQLHRKIRGALPDFDGEGKPLTRPAEYLRFALRAEELFANIKDGYSDTAYLAGLHFDVLVFAAGRLVGDDPARQKALLAYFDALFSQGLERAKRGAELARANPKFTGKKFLFSACLLADVGKGALALLEPDYLGFEESVEKTKPPRTVRMTAELKRFGTSHALVSAWIVRFAALLLEIEPALRFHHDPILLRAGNPSMHELASLISQSAP